MKVRIIKTGRTAVYNISYARRLIEQGRAVVYREENSNGAERQDT